MLPFLLLVHAGLGAGLVAARTLPADQRGRVVRGAGVIGATAGLLLFLVRGSDDPWGTLSLDEGRAGVAAASVFCAWLLVAATGDERGRWEIAALVGAASAGLIAFSLNGWIAPALLFWICVSAASVVAAVRARDAGSSPIFVGLSDACVVGALVTWAVEHETWQLPERLEGWPFYLAVAGVTLRAGALPRLGAWGLAEGSAVALIPLLIGSGFALVPAVSGGDEVLVALPLLAAGLLAGLWSAVRSPQVVLGAGWLVATMLALVFVEPAALAKASAAAVLTATAVLLWPWAGGRAGPERGLLVAAVPLTVGFGPIVGGAVASFDRASTADTILSGAPWTAFAALLPAALALGVTVGAAIGRRVEPETYRPAAVLATWAVALVALLLGLTGGVDLDFELGGELGLYLVAAVAGAGAARLAPLQPIRSEPVTEGPAVGVLAWPDSVSGLVGKAGVVLVGAALLTAVAFTYVGLKTGFL